MGERGGTAYGSLSGRDESIELGVAALRDARLDELQRARDTGQEVVEVVGNAARQVSDCVHFLGLAQMLFEPAALRYVPGADDETAAEAELRRNGGGQRFDDGIAMGTLVVIGSAAAHRLRQMIIQGPRSLRVEHLVHCASDDLIARAAIQFERRRVDLLIAENSIRNLLQDRVAFGGMLEEHPDEILAGGHLLGQALVFAILACLCLNVDSGFAADTQKAGNLPSLIPKWRE